ncbi:MAG: response regulator [Elusimicrobia bacterium]|nr:response regulator [Elusimicrobiota bacterium]
MPKKILIVDDNRDTVVSLNYALEKTGYEVAYAYDGQEGYIKAVEWQPNLIVLDVMMPVMDGYTMNRHLKDNPQTQHIPVVIITAREGIRSLFDPEQKAHVDAYMTKPFDFKMLIEKVQELLAEGKK